MCSVLGVTTGVSSTEGAKGGCVGGGRGDRDRLSSHLTADFLILRVSVLQSYETTM